jgi:hypothetical protein
MAKASSTWPSGQIAISASLSQMAIWLSGLVKAFGKDFYFPRCQLIGITGLSLLN